LLSDSQPELLCRTSKTVLELKILSGKLLRIL
jgi:hypothetical protein